MTRRYCKCGADLPDPEELADTYGDFLVESWKAWDAHPRNGDYRDTVRLAYVAERFGELIDLLYGTCVGCQKDRAKRAKIRELSAAVRG